MGTRKTLRLASLALACALPFSSTAAVNAQEASTPAPQEYDINLGDQHAVRYVLDGSDQPQGLGEKQLITERYGPCTLSPSVVHVRTGTPSEGKVIGFKPFTQCDRPVESISHESRLKYEYYLWWRDAPLAGGVPARSSNSDESRLEQRSIEFHCNGDVDTNFIGNTVGTVVAAGRTYHAAVNTPLFREACKV
ncbi:hypothetical protein DLJ54_05450 [Corynebacterium heidelbergense]|uniref:DUF3558 domain-containing protein n=1 Tax=Corynebacterium heidelbergense TaxID=2055947 RepID=A0A364V5X1_9CORY|nr:hypothetical protein DLJ54_05450 [Corynebacterium heidelbergense]